MTTENQRTASSKSLIVVGAGAAGIKLAHALLVADSTAFREITILEANNYIGGRVRNFKFEGHTVEMGANWISGREAAFDNPIWKLAQDIELQGHPSERENPDGMMVLDCTNSNEANNDVTKIYMEQVKRFDNIYDRALAARKQAEAEGRHSNANSNTNTSVRQVLEQHGWTPKSELNDVERAVEHNVLEVWVAESLENLSAEYDMRPGANDVELGQDEIFVEDSRGLNSIFDGMVHDLKQGTNSTRTIIRMEMEVQSIHYAPGNVKVIAKDVKTGTVAEFHGDAVVSTVSIGVLQSNAIAFVPPLPAWKRAALGEMKMFNFAKVYAKFDCQLWPDNKDYFLFVTKGEGNRGHYPLWMRYKNAKDNLLMCYLGGAQARRVETLEEEQLKNEIEDLFFQGFGGGRSREECRPVAVTTTDWSRNPLFCGSYSYFPKGAFASVPYRNLGRGLTGVPEGDKETTENDLRLPTTLYFAGEALDDKYNGWIQGGYLSGERVAMSMLSSSLSS